MKTSLIAIHLLALLHSAFAIEQNIFVHVTMGVRRQ